MLVTKICQHSERKIFRFFLPGRSSTAKRILSFEYRDPTPLVRHMKVHGENLYYYWLISDKPQKVSQSASTFYVLKRFFLPPPIKCLLVKRAGKIMRGNPSIRYHSLYSKQYFVFILLNKYIVSNEMYLLRLTRTIMPFDV